MATKTRSIRAAEALWTVLDSTAKARGIPPNALASELLAEGLGLTEREPERAPPKPKAAPKAPPPAIAAQLATKPPRDLAPKIGEADTAGSARGGGIVSGMDLPLGNQRGAYQKGAPRPGKR